MGGYTKVNLKQDVEDQAQHFKLSPDLEFRMARVALELENSGVSFLRLAPDFRIPFGHNHKTQEEVYVVVAGSARVKVEDEVLDLVPWDAIRVAKETMRSFEAGPDGVEIIAIGAPTTGPGDGNITQGWWSD
jgi:mannose-6-phosphate isomerase-like protein (cupin superfamily)